MQTRNLKDKSPAKAKQPTKQAEAEAKKPIKQAACAVKGLVAKGHMCGAVIMGGICGFAGECKHKVLAE